MIYLDTSFIAPLFREEATSKKIADYLARQAQGTLVTSKWSVVEYASVVSRYVRMRELSEKQGRTLLDEFNAVVDASFNMVVPGPHDFELAAEYVGHFATQLRAPDALHLAMAHNHAVEFVATLDEGMLAAAKKLKVPAKRVIR